MLTNCASPAHRVDHYLGVKAPMVNLSLLEASGLHEVVAPTIGAASVVVIGTLLARRRNGAVPHAASS